MWSPSRLAELRGQTDSVPPPLITSVSQQRVWCKLVDIVAGRLHSGTSTVGSARCTSLELSIPRLQISDSCRRGSGRYFELCGCLSQALPRARRQQQNRACTAARLQRQDSAGHRRLGYHRHGLLAPHIRRWSPRVLRKSLVQLRCRRRKLLRSCPLVDHRIFLARQVRKLHNGAPLEANLVENICIVFIGRFRSCGVYYHLQDYVLKIEFRQACNRYCVASSLKHR